MESLSSDKRALLTEKFHALLDGSDIVGSLETFFPSSSKDKTSSSKDKKFTEPGAEAPVLPHRALFVLCYFFPPTP